MKVRITEAATTKAVAVKKLEDPVPISVHGGAVDFMVEGRRQRVLNDINLVSLFGSSGRGKSTLSKMMAGLVALSEGTISVAGIAPQEAANARLIGRTFHDATGCLGRLISRRSAPRDLHPTKPPCTLLTPRPCSTW
jgi:ABC-type sulfate/molybdate transport systems ATPase subunit